MAGRDHLGRLLGSAKMLLSPDQERIVRAAWAAGDTNSECAQLIGVPVGRFYERLKDQLRDLPRRGRGCRMAREGRDRLPPGPAEIQAAAALIRATWTRDRWLGQVPDDEPPEE